MSEDFLPTDEQAKIIGHNEGPALVFAVAGSGKTTTIVHRIARLCSEGKFAPSSILATCFNSSAAGNLRKDLAKLNVPAEFEVKEIERGKAVRVHTLNGLGSSILRHAAQLGLTSKYKLAEDIRNDIIHPAIQSAKRDPILSRCLQSMDTDDFLEYVSLCKANIQYPDLVSANLPEMAGKIATQATAPSDVRAKWYLDFYRYFEEERTKLELLTFDDQLLCAWDSLVRFPILLRDIRARHQCVIVDEFQDIN